MRSAGVAAVTNLEVRLSQHAADLRNLQASHAALAASFKGCCKNDSALLFMVRTAVEEQLAAVRDVWRFKKNCLLLVLFRSTREEKPPDCYSISIVIVLFIFNLWVGGLAQFVKAWWGW